MAKGKTYTSIYCDTTKTKANGLWNCVSLQYGIWIKKSKNKSVKPPSSLWHDFRRKNMYKFEKPADWETEKEREWEIVTSRKRNRNIHRKKCNGWRFRDVYATCPCSLPSSHTSTSPDPSPWTAFTRICYDELCFEIFTPFFSLTRSLDAADVCWLFRFGYIYSQRVLPCFNNMCLVPQFFFGCCLFLFSLSPFFRLLQFPCSVQIGCDFMRMNFCSISNCH